MKLYTIVSFGSFAFSTIANAWTDSAVHRTVLPTDIPPGTSYDPWECALANLTQYFDPPQPTGSLLSAIESYAVKLGDACTIMDVVDRLQGGCYPSHDDLCKFTTAAPASLMSDYSLYGSAASVWWAAHSSNAVFHATDCPEKWFNAMYEFVNGRYLLNDTINYAACYADAISTTTFASSNPISTSSVATAVTRPGVTGVATASVTPTATSGVEGRGEELGIWVLAGAGLAAAAANSMWNSNWLREREEYWSFWYINRHTWRKRLSLSEELMNNNIVRLCIDIIESCVNSK